jgi:hypothetical protein
LSGMCTARLAFGHCLSRCPGYVQHDSTTARWYTTENPVTGQYSVRMQYT